MRISSPILRRLAIATGSLFVVLMLVAAVRQPVASAGSLTFSGTVLTPSGAPFTEGGGVNLNTSGNGFWSGIQGDGSFSIEGLNPGTYTLDVGISNSSTYASPAQQQVTITANITGYQIKVATPVVTGTLAKPDGTSTNGCITVRTISWTVERHACPSESDNGRFKIGSLDAGTYLLSTSPPDNSPYVGTDQTITISDPSTTLDLGLVKLENPFIIGKVALPDGSPLVWDNDWNRRIHLSVDLWNNDRTVDRHSNYDQDSKFKFGSMPAGSYTIHVNVWDTELYTGSENVTITVPAGGLDMTASSIKLSTPQLSGVVYRPDGTTPVQNANVNVHNDDWSVNQGSGTDANGKYRIGGLAPGTYKLEVNPPQEMTDVVRQDPVDITITSALQTRNITLSAAKKFVSGVVKKKDGTPVSCAQVNANRRGGNGWSSARTASDGTYTLTLQPGSWSLRVERSGDWGCQTPDWIFLDPEVIVDFSDTSATETQNANFTVQKATAVITGKVAKKDGTPVTNGNVNANSQTQNGRNRNANAQIGSDGTYTLNLTGGTYDLNVWTNDQRLFTRNQKVTVADSQSVTANFTMGEKLAHIKGLVTDKAGKPLPGIQLNGNLDCGPNGCAAWSNTTTAADGTYDMAVTSGHWFINFDSGRGQAYVYDGTQQDIYVETETSTVTGVNFVLTYADVTIEGNVVDESGNILSSFPGWAYLRPLTVTAGNGMREYGGPVNQGAFSFRVPSSIYSQGELGVHTPQNSQYSSPTGQTVTLVADAKIKVNITVKKNDAAIVGKMLDSSGLPLQACNFRGEVFANTPNSWYGTQINPDCTFEVTLLAGTYNLGYHIDESAGILNRPLPNSQITVGSGTRTQYDIKVLVGNARISVQVLNPDGTPARRVWVRAENRKEIDDQRRMSEEKSRQGQGGQQGFQGPGGTTSPEAMIKYCLEKGHEKECKDFKFPPGSEGPGGSKDALAAAKYCAEHKDECRKMIEGAPGENKKVVSQSVNQRRAKIAGYKLVKAQSEDQPDKGNDPFENMISTGSETNDKGVASLSVLSGHLYQIDTGLPPETAYLPPKTQDVDLKDTKSAAVTLTLRTADGKMTGFVTWNKVAVRNGWVGCWSEDGSSNGSPIINGTYSINYSFNTTYHCDANSFDGSKFLRSGEQIVTIGTKKTTTQHFTVDQSSFDIPPPVSESFDATQPHVMTLADGASFNIPANTIASSGTVTVTANPTINVQSQVTAKPIGYGYSLEAKDENGQVVSTFSNNITATFYYTQAQLDEAGVSEASLVPSYWDSASGTWKKPSNITQTEISQSSDGRGVITTTTNHFTAYAIVSSGGKAGRNLVSVTTKAGKGKVQQIVVGSGKSKVTFTPFSGYKGKLTVTTFSAGKAGQLIAAAQGDKASGPTTVKVFTLKGKLKQTMKPWGSYAQGVSSFFAQDVTKNGYDDLVAAPNSGTSVFVVEFQTKKSYAVKASSTSANVQAAALDLGHGGLQLVTATGSKITVYNFGKRGFAAEGYDPRRVQVTSAGIQRVYLQPVLSGVTPRSAKRGKSVTLTITGQNLGSGSRVLVDGTQPAKKVVASGDTKLTATFDLSSLKVGKHDLQVINSDGAQNTWQRVLSVK